MKEALWTQDRAERFFEHIANGASVYEASRQAGVSSSSGYRKFEKIRRHYGAQAE